MIANKNVLIIAEIGTAHGGSLEKAKKYIDTAVQAGADCVKFQIVYANEILHPKTGVVTLPGGDISLYERFKSLEQPIDFFVQCAEYAKQNDILFCASPFGSQSLQELFKLEPFAIKIASPELNHIPLLKELAEIEKKRTNDGKKQIPIILSSGVSKAADIELALDILQDVQDKALLHCVTSYPAPEEEYNLNILSVLSTLFDIPCGISDHSLHPIIVPTLATACGATIIEKHLCMQKNTDGLDDPIALEPDEFEAMVKTVRLASRMPKEEVIKMAKDEFGLAKVEAVLGNGKKHLSKSEKQNYGRTNRSIHFTKDLSKGQKITHADVAVLRTEKILSVGLHPKYLEQVIGATLTQNALDGEGLSWNHLIHNA